MQIDLQNHLNAHPSMTPQDVVKLCYQAAFGAEHLLKDPSYALHALQEEYDLTPADDQPLFETLSDRVCRVNLSAWKARQLPAHWLGRMFTASAQVAPDGKARFATYLQEAEAYYAAHTSQFAQPFSAWKAYMEGYRAAGMPAVHHSAAYREKEHPAYRIVHRRYCLLFPLLERIQACLAQKGRCVVALDGRAASGKTTLAQWLCDVLQSDTVHMDDFFLPPALRTPSRREEAGGNVHYERFAQEVLPHLGKGLPFAYRAFDCSTMAMGGEVSLTGTPITLVEGSYSGHPAFGNYADIRCFITVPPEAQLQRILARNGEEMLRAFQEKWIPMEEAYFAAFAIPEKAHVLLETEARHG